MFRLELLVTFTILVFSDTLADSVLDEGKLIFVQVLYRHGDRTPIDPYPNDPYKDPSQWPTEWGQLTNVGKEQHYELGKWLRARYDAILNETYTKTKIHIRSTDVDRTLMSAMANLAGLYPPKGREMWNPQIFWQPIPVHTEPEDNDHILAMKKSCPAYDRKLSSWMKSDDYLNFNKRFREVYDYLTVHTGQEIRDVDLVNYLYSVLFIEEINNKTLPEWTKKVYPEPLKSISAYGFSTSTYTRDLARLKAGPLLLDILERFQEKATTNEKHTERVMQVYSAHDSTVAALLNTLRVFDPPHNPPFRACIMMELRLHKGTPYVNLVYKNDTEPKNLEIPECGMTCPLSKMFEIYKDVLPKHWEKECYTKDFLSDLSEFPKFSDWLKTYAFPIFFGVTAIFIAVMIFTIITQRRSRILYRAM